MKEIVIVIEPIAGDHIKEISKKAFKMAIEKKCLVRFNFNDLVCRIDAETNLDSFYRDYTNAHIMEWSDIGPVCVLQYDTETEIKICIKRLEKAFRRKWNEDLYKQNNHV